MKLLLTFVTLVLLAKVNADKGAQDSNLSMVLVKGLQTQLKTCMDQNRDLVQRSCQKPGHWRGNRGNPVKKRATAFHAELSNSIQNLPHNHKVVFDKIHLNEGGAYDPKTGIFTCKEPGIYVFDWTILTNDGQYFSTDLMVDGEVRGRLHLAASNIKNDRSGSNMVVAKLKPGSKVWVEPYSTYTGQYAHGRWSSFSGFKI